MPRNILIVKLGAIGDVVMTFPLISAIDALEPDAHITWLCGKTVEPLVRTISRINNVIAIDESALLKGSFAQKFSTILSAWRTLGGKSYDVVLNLYRDRRYRILTHPFMSKDIRSFSGKKRTKKIIPGRYHAYEFIKLYNGKDDFSIESISIPQVTFPQKSNTLSDIDFNKNKTVVIAAGGASNILNTDDVRRWDIFSYVELAKQLSDAGYQIILTGGPQDSWVTSNFQGMKITNLIGKTSLMDVLTLLNSSTLLITHDTGILHMAKLTNTRTIALFGPVLPAERIGKTDNIITLWGGINLACAPCYDGKTFAKCSNNLCMKNITVEQVFNTAIAHLS